MESRVDNLPYYFIMAIKNEEKLKVTVATLANASDLVANVILDMAGNDIANTIGGDSLTKQAIFDLSQSCFNKQLAPVIR